MIRLFQPSHHHRLNYMFKTNKHQYYMIWRLEILQIAISTMNKMWKYIVEQTKLLADALWVNRKKIRIGLHFKEFRKSSMLFIIVSKRIFNDSLSFFALRIGQSDMCKKGSNTKWLIFSYANDGHAVLHFRVCDFPETRVQTRKCHMLWCIRSLGLGVYEWIEKGTCIYHVVYCLFRLWLMRSFRKWTWKLTGRVKCLRSNFGANRSPGVRRIYVFFLRSHK